MKDYYYMLGVERNASAEEIKAAYKKLSSRLHPDKNDGDKFFENRFKEIAEAYEILTNDVERALYDTSLLNTRRKDLPPAPQQTEKENPSQGKSNNTKRVYIIMLGAIIILLAIFILQRIPAKTTTPPNLNNTTGKDSMPDERVLYLNELVKRKNVTINKLNAEIELQNAIINKQHEKVQFSQMQQWYDLGVELYRVYSEYNDISGGIFNGKNKKRMAENKRNVLLKSKKCFEEAAALGHADAEEQILRINSELQRI